MGGNVWYSGGSFGGGRLSPVMSPVMNHPRGDDGGSLSGETDS